MFDQHRSFLPSVDVCFVRPGRLRTEHGWALPARCDREVKTARVLATMAIVGALLPCRSRVEGSPFFHFVALAE